MDADEICNAPSAGMSEEPSYTTPDGFPVCSRCGRSTRNMNYLLCKPCQSGTRLLLTPADRKMLRAMGISTGEAQISFDDAVASVREVAPGRVTVVTYDGLRRALEAGEDVWHFADTITLQAVVRDHGTPEQKARLRRELIAEFGGGDTA